MTDAEAIEAFDRKLAARKARNTAADEFACAVCDLMGGDAEIEGTAERMEIFRWVWRLPKFAR